MLLMVVLIALDGDDSDDDGDDEVYDGNGGGGDCDHRNEGVVNAHRTKPKPSFVGIASTEPAHTVSFGLTRV